MISEDQIKEVMQRGELWAQCAWNGGKGDEDEIAKIVPARADLEAYLRTIKPAQSVNAELLEALKDARHCIGIDRDTLVDCHTNPCTGYLDPDGALAKAEYDDVIDAADAAIARAESAMPFWPDHSSAISDPLFHQARGIMGTENFGQEEGLRLAILHVLNARAESAIETPASADTRIGDALNDPRLQEIFGAAIEGAMGFGYQDTNRPPAGHWLERFWKIGAAQQEANETRACETCGGRGEVGGFVGGGAPGYETHPCPDCRADDAGGAA